MKRQLSFLLIVFVFVFITGCNKDKKDDIIPKDDFEQILVEIHLMDGINKQNTLRKKLAEENDSLNYYDAILRSHNYTRPQFDSSMLYYSKNLNKFDDIYENVLSELNRLEAEAEEKLEEQRQRKQRQKEKAQKEQEKRLGNPYKIKLGTKVKIKR